MSNSFPLQSLVWMKHEGAMGRRHDETHRSCYGTHLTCLEILRRWDPRGVRPGKSAPADEYDSYAPHIVSMVAQGGSLEGLCAHLESIRLETIGVGPDPVRDREIANEILLIV